MPRTLGSGSLATALLLASTAVPVAAQTGTFPDVSIVGSRVECRAVALVASLFEYRYAVSNPATNDAGVASVSLDISAPLSLRPEMLTTTGFFLGDGSRQAVNPLSGHVPVGLDIPADWGGNLTPRGALEWYARGDGQAATRPVAPGTESTEFLVRSTYLPGIRSYRLLPDYPFHCCPFPAGDPRNDTVHVKSAFDFRSDGLTIAPTYEPGAVTIGLVQSLRSQVCEMGWITKAGVCHALEEKLADAAAALAANDREGARGSLGAFLNQLDAQHVPGANKAVTDNAYGVLRANVEALLARL